MSREGGRPALPAHDFWQAPGSVDDFAVALLSTQAAVALRH